MNLSCLLLVNLFHLLLPVSICHSIDLTKLSLSRRLYEIKNSLMNFDEQIFYQKSQFVKVLSKLST
uniref:Uncharacterized protein n=1 Tax=Schistosoma mansoni TaxID=6183 RepID=A0A913KUS8_SCHMA